MAYIWSVAETGAWQAVSLAAETCARDLAGEPVFRRVAGCENTWALLTRPDTPILVNGLPVPHGIVVLADRDEICVPSPPGAGANRLYFSTERLAAIAPYPADGRRGACPRCKQHLTAGEPAVCCPSCGLWHHASDALPCWTYAEHCAACPQPSTLDAGFQWTPEDL